jgi:probable HAF family extracellular repeat protein
MVDLGTLGGPSAQATAINDAGMVTGRSDAITQTGAVGPTETYVTHAFLYGATDATGLVAKEMMDLGTLGGEYSYGTAINARSHVSGYSTLSGEGNVRAFLFNGKKMHDLGSLHPDGSKSDQSFALAMNDYDQVVGHSYIGENETENVRAIAAGVFGSPLQVAFLYQDGVMTDLNKLIGKETSNYHLYSASGINNDGQIIACAFDYQQGVFRAVLLTPNTRQ